MDDLTISSGFIENLATVIGAAGRAVQLHPAATTSGMDGLESTQAIAALTESTRERIQRAQLSNAAFAALASTTVDVATQLIDADRKLAGLSKSPS